MIVVTFVEFVPPRRFDGIPWNRVRIEEAAAETGPWFPIETVALAPLDSDPASPNSRSFTTDAATQEQGWYRVVFLDETNIESQPSDPLHNVADEGSEYTPTVSQVAALLRARTKDNVGNELGEFTANTRPTANEVAKLIEAARHDVITLVGEDFDPTLWPQARNATLYRAAMFVELSYYPEQINTERSPYIQMKELYESALARFEQEETGVTPDSDELYIGKSNYWFPTSAEMTW